MGFGKTLGQTYELMAGMAELQEPHLPVLVGISRTAMIWKLTGGTPATSLPGTTALHALAVERGASILRVHDVAEAVQTVAVVEKMKQSLTKEVI